MALSMVGMKSSPKMSVGSLNQSVSGRVLKMSGGMDIDAEAENSGAMICSKKEGNGDIDGNESIGREFEPPVIPIPEASNGPGCGKVSYVGDSPWLTLDPLGEYVGRPSFCGLVCERLSDSGVGRAESGSVLLSDLVSQVIFRL